MLRVSPLLLAACLVFVPPALHADDVAVTLSGSRASMLRQNGVAKAESYTFLRTPTQVQRYVDDGRLLPMDGNADYAVIAGYPYARPAVRSFVERLAGDYRGACGEKLVVTSLTRPSTRQPRNASPLSVHPAGMAVDLRVSADAGCRTWLERELLALEERGVLDATREYNPPHFHVAVFPTPYLGYEEAIAADSVAAEAVRLLEAAVAAREGGYDLTPHVVAIELPRPAPLVRIASWIARMVLPLPV